MSKLEELIQELCPDGVEYHSLGDSCKIETGKLNANAAVEDGQYMFFTTAKEPSRINKYRWDTEALLIAGNANIGEVKHYTGKFEAYQRTYVLTEFKQNILVRFVYYSLCNNLKQYLEKHKNEAAMTYIVLSTLEGFRIPIPPLPVQEEIVRILDNFTELTTELTTELEARKKQYEYYRDELLNMEGAPCAKLKELTTKVEAINWKSCTESKSYIDLSSVNRENHSIIDDDVIVVNAENAPSRARQIIHQNDILFGGTRPLLKRSCIVPSRYDNQVCSTGYCVLRVDNSKALTNFVYHCIGTSSFYSYVEANQQGASYPAIGDNVLKEYAIPLPPLAEQERVVAILDRFDALCNDLSSGLPAEIEARKKQYEYYRDKLLTFKELGA